MLEKELLIGEGDMEKRHVVMVKKGEFLPVTEKEIAAHEESREQKNLRLQLLLKDMIAQAVQNSNEEIYKDMKNSILKEIDYQFRLQEEREESREKERTQREEEHFKQIDELLRERSLRKEKIFKEKGSTEKGFFRKKFAGKKRSAS